MAVQGQQAACPDASRSTPPPRGLTSSESVVRSSAGAPCSGSPPSDADRGANSRTRHHRSAFAGFGAVVLVGRNLADGIRLANPAPGLNNRVFASFEGATPVILDERGLRTNNASIRLGSRRPDLDGATSPVRLLMSPRCGPA